MNLRLQVNGSGGGGSFNLPVPGFTQGIVTLPPRVVAEQGSAPTAAALTPSTPTATPPPPDTRTFIPVAVSLSGSAFSAYNIFSVDGLVRPLLRGTTVEHAPQVNAGACALVSGVPLCANLGYQQSYFPSVRSYENAPSLPTGQTEPVYRGANLDVTLASRGPWIRFLGDPNSNGVAWYWGRPLSELGLGISIGQFEGGAAGQAHDTLVGVNLIDTRSNFLNSTSVEATVGGRRFALTASLGDSRQTRLWGNSGAQYVGESCAPGRNCVHEGSDVSSAPAGGPSLTLTYLPNHTAFSRDPSFHPVNTQEFLNYLGVLSSVYASGQLRGEIAQDAVYRPLTIPGNMWLNTAIGLYEQASTGAQIGVAAASLEDMLRRGRSNVGISLAAGAAYTLLAGLHLFPALTDAQWSVVTPSSTLSNTASLNAPATLISGSLAVAGAYIPGVGPDTPTTFHIVNTIVLLTGVGLLVGGGFSAPSHPLDGDYSTPQAAEQTTRNVMAFSASNQLQFRADQMSAFQIATLGASLISFPISRWALGSTWLRSTNATSSPTRSTEAAQRLNGIQTVQLNVNDRGASVTLGGRF